MGATRGNAHPESARQSLDENIGCGGAWVPLGRAQDALVGQNQTGQLQYGESDRLPESIETFCQRQQSYLSLGSLAGPSQPHHAGIPDRTERLAPDRMAAWLRAGSESHRGCLEQHQGTRNGKLLCRPITRGHRRLSPGPSSSSAYREVAPFLSSARWSFILTIL